MVAVPPAVVTATLFAPTVPAGAVAVIDVALTTTTLVAATPFTVTLVAPVKLVPVIVMDVPPRVEPDAGVTLEIVGLGAGTTYVNASVLVAVPPAVVTTTSLAPAVPVGESAVIEVALTTTLVADTPPTVTLLAPLKLVPVIVMNVPPRVEPDDGVTLEIVGIGIGTTYVNAPVLVAVPPAVVTTTSLAPAVPTGVMAVIEVALATTLVAGTPPTVTLLALLKLVPTIVNAVPPVVGPEVGLTETKVGIGGSYSIM